MKFDMFKEMVRENISNKMGSDYEVILEDVTKNNGVILTGVLIRMPGENISPTIYLNDYYEMFKRAEISIHQIVARIIDIFNTSRPTIDFDIKRFMNYEYIKKKLVLKMVNTEKNRELLQEIPHVNYLDLSMIFQIILTIDGCEDNATITVTNQHVFQHARRGLCACPGRYRRCEAQLRHFPFRLSAAPGRHGRRGRRIRN